MRRVVSRSSGSTPGQQLPLALDARGHRPIDRAEALHREDHRQASAIGRVGGPLDQPLRLESVEAVRDGGGRQQQQSMELPRRHAERRSGAAERREHEELPPVQPELRRGSLHALLQDLGQPRDAGGDRDRSEIGVGSFVRPFPEHDVDLVERRGPGGRFGEAVLGRARDVPARPSGARGRSVSSVMTAPPRLARDGSATTPCPGVVTSPSGFSTQMSSSTRCSPSRSYTPVTVPRHVRSCARVVEASVASSRSARCVPRGCDPVVQQVAQEGVLQRAVDDESRQADRPRVSTS